MYDPVVVAEETAKVITRGKLRKYYRFRSARFYGGIATADCVGCCLRCAFCWGWSTAVNPTGSGTFHSPEEVVQRLCSIASSHGFHKVRLSGNEPTLARDHLLSVLEQLPEGVDFILETNGILLGHDAGYAEALSTFSNLHVRVSFKGSSPEEFSRLTDAEPEAFWLPLRALENLLHAGVSCHPAVMTSFSSPAAKDDLRERLDAIHPSFGDFEEEEVFLNEAAKKRLAVWTGLQGRQ